MKHNYLEWVSYLKNEAIDNILSFANGDIEWYFENKAEAEKDEDLAEDFKVDEEIERYGMDYRFDREDIDEAISFLNYVEECMPEELNKSIEDFEKYDRKLDDAEYKIERIEKRIKNLVEAYNVKNYYIETSRKSVSTYLYMPNNPETRRMVLDEADECDYYEDMEQEDFLGLDELCIRFSDHDTGSYWSWDYGDVSYDDDHSKIFIY